MTHGCGVIRDKGNPSEEDMIHSVVVSLLSETVQFLPQLFILHLTLLIVAAAQRGVAVAVSPGRVAQSRRPLPFLPLPLLPPSPPPLSLQAGQDRGAVRLRLLSPGLGPCHREAPHFPVAAPLAWGGLPGRGGFGWQGHRSHLGVQKEGVLWELTRSECLSGKRSASPT